MLFSSHSAFAGWMAKADFTSCPRKYFPNTHGEEGPFDSQSACQTRVDQAKREQQTVCVQYSCVEQAAGSTNSQSPQAGHEMDQHISTAISAGMNGQISGSDTVGLVSMGLLGNALLAGNRQLTPEEQAARNEQSRIWAEQQAKANEESRAKEAAYQADQDTKALAMLDLAESDFSPSSVAPPAAKSPPKPAPVSTVYSKGYEHASSCISQNSGTACAGVTAAEQQHCVSDYNAGYSNGTKKRNLDMDEALRIGEADGAKGALANGPANAKASGPCRVEWIETYNRGYFNGKHAKPKGGKP